MSNASILPLVAANLLLGALVLVPAVAVTVSVLRRIVSRRRPVRWVEIPGVGRIPVLDEKLTRHPSSAVRSRTS